MGFKQFFKRSIISRYLNLLFRVDMELTDFNDKLNMYARGLATGIFCFVLLGKPIVGLIFFSEISFNSLFLSVLFSPLVAGGLLFFELSPYWVRVLGFFYSVIIFISTCILVQALDFAESGFFVYLEFRIFKVFNWSISVGLDNFSVLFVILTAFLFCLTFLACWFNTKSLLFFFELLFIIEFILFWVFTVLDIFWFFVVYEAVIVPVFLIIGIWGGRIQRVFAAYLFFYYTFAGSIAMLFSIIYIYLVVGSTSFSVISTFHFTILEQFFLFSSFFIAFASKLPLYPLHSWLPEAHVEAPTAGSVLLAGILLKMGGYGIVRWCFTFFPLMSSLAVDFVNTIASLSILYSSFSALQQLDVKRIIAYSSIAHMGFVVMGLFTFTETGFLGSIFLMISHGFISGGLFLCIGVLYDRYGTRSILYYGGLGALMPSYDMVFFVLCLANIALPGTAGFPGEFLVLYSVYTNAPLLFGVLLFGVFMTGIYTVWMYCRIMMGPIDLNNFVFKFSDITFRELCMFWMMVLVVFVFGLFPSFIFSICDFWIISFLSCLN